MSIVQKLTEGIVNRDLGKEGAALIAKWENTGLLEGLANDNVRNGMARLLENQAKELLREASSMSAGDVEGFAAVAFPLVRRVFGNLIANDLVSVQPMSLPSGLIFFLDFLTSDEYGASSTGALPRVGYPTPASSLYGGGTIAAQLTGGVNLASGSLPEQGPYALNNGYSSPTGSLGDFDPIINNGLQIIASGTVGGNDWASGIDGLGSATAGNPQGDRHLDGDRLVEFDPDLSGSFVCVASVPLAQFNSATVGEQFNLDDLVTITLNDGGSRTGPEANGALTLGGLQVRRLTRPDYSVDGNILLVVQQQTSTNAASSSLVSADQATFTITDRFSNGGQIGSVVGGEEWALEGNGEIPEIDIKVDSVAVTAITKKLKAKWTPELGQDLNAYHNLDAEVELTQILSEQVALEIDREIVEDLVRGAKAATLYWSRNPGKFLNRTTGADISAGTSPPDFTGNVSEWYETLIETINDVSAQIHRKTLRGAANFCVCGPEVANILEFTAGFRANVTADSDRGDAGAVKVGSLSKKFDIIVDPYFPRNLVLVGRRGSSFLESGYVYAPYVPLQTTPTIFGVEDFVPRKGVMTRYAKKMVRPDMYGLVVVRDLV
jgi:hypothetical protein